jgi:C4-type Zn-finger protein
MPMSIRRPCPACGTGEGAARRVTTVPDRPVVAVTLVCESCGYEWQIDYDSPPMRPTIKPSDHTRAS